MKLDCTINGTSLSEHIGLQVLNVVGRESLSKDHESLDVQGIDGEFKYSSRYPIREIEITYKMLWTTQEGYRAAHNKMNALLDKDELKVVFSDEPDKYFTASKGDCDGDKITLICFDPFKYSTT